MHLSTKKILSKIKQVEPIKWVVVGLSTLCVILFLVLVLSKNKKSPEPPPTTDMGAFSDVMKVYVDSMEARLVRRQDKHYEAILDLEQRNFETIKKGNRLERKFYNKITHIEKLIENAPKADYNDSTTNSIINRLGTD